LEAKDISFEQSGDKGAQEIAGAIFETQLDLSHPINFGMPRNTMPIFRNTSIIIEPNKNSYNNPIQYTKNPLISGYISKQNLELLKGTVPFQSIKGDGKIIVLQITRILDHSGWVQKSCYGMLFSLAT
jgi:hypothetical protein